MENLCKENDYFVGNEWGKGSGSTSHAHSTFMMEQELCDMLEFMQSLKSVLAQRSQLDFFTDSR